MKNLLPSYYLVVTLTTATAPFTVWAVEGHANTIDPKIGQVSAQAYNQSTVLGQNPLPSEGTAFDAAQENQNFFKDTLQHMMPLSGEQIQEYRQHSDKRERALRPMSPELSSRTVRVSLESGQKPIEVKTTANIATSLVFHDVTGQAWPVTSVTNGGSSFFQVLRPELPDGNLLNVMPTQDYGTSTLVVTLENKDIPLVIRLESDSVRSPKRKADALVLFQVSQHGPKARMPIISTTEEAVTSAMLSFLDRVAPNDAVRIETNPSQEKLMVWEYKGKHYIRTSQALMWPAWSAVVNGAGEIKCYEVPITPRLMLSVNGTIQSVSIHSSRLDGQGGLDGQDE